MAARSRWPVSHLLVDVKLKVQTAQGERKPWQHPQASANGNGNYAYVRGLGAPAVAAPGCESC